MHSVADPFEIWPKHNERNFVALTPVPFLEKTTRVHPRRLAVVHDDFRHGWSEIYRR